MISFWISVVPPKIHWTRLSSGTHNRAGEQRKRHDGSCFHPRRDRAAGSRRQPRPGGKRSSKRDHTPGDDFIRIGGFDDAQPDMYIQHYLGASSVRVPAADLDFIAHARQDIRTG